MHSNLDSMMMACNSFIEAIFALVLNSAAIRLLTGVYVIALHLDFDGRRAFRS